MEITSPENDKEERLSDEDNRPLSNRLKEKLQNKLEQKQRSVKRGGMKTGKETKRAISKDYRFSA